MQARDSHAICRNSILSSPPYRATADSSWRLQLHSNASEAPPEQHDLQHEPKHASQLSRTNMLPFLLIPERAQSNYRSCTKSTLSRNCEPCRSCLEFRLLNCVPILWHLQQKPSWHHSTAEALQTPHQQSSSEITSCLAIAFPEPSRNRKRPGLLAAGDRNWLGVRAFTQRVHSLFVHAPQRW